MEDSGSSPGVEIPEDMEFVMAEDKSRSTSVKAHLNGTPWIEMRNSWWRTPDWSWTVCLSLQMHIPITSWTITAFTFQIFFGVINMCSTPSPQDPALPPNYTEHHALDICDPLMKLDMRGSLFLTQVWAKPRITTTKGCYNLGDTACQPWYYWTAWKLRIDLQINVGD